MGRQYFYRLQFRMRMRSARYWRGQNAEMVRMYRHEAYLMLLAYWDARANSL